MTRRAATGCGALAIALWSTLAAASTQVANIPPLQLTAMTFGTAAMLTALHWKVRGESFRRHLAQPALGWLVGVGGLTGYHVLYFVVLRLAPPAEANVINYLWPLLIIFFSAALPGERIRPAHVMGGALSFLGTALVITAGHRAALDLSSHRASGYVAALACAVVWAAYSVASRRLRNIPSGAVGGYCGATALLALALHLVLERSVWPSPSALGIVVLLGCGPLGAAFFLWDVGMKQGDHRALAAFSYVGQLASTSLLVLLGLAPLSTALALGAVLVTAGAAIGTGNLWSSRGRTPKAQRAGTGT